MEAKALDHQMQVGEPAHRLCLMVGWLVLVEGVAVFRSRIVERRALANPLEVAAELIRQ
jgi:hypothetical protein